MSRATAQVMAHLDLNNSGAWKRLFTFDVEAKRGVLHSAACLFHDAGERCTLRVVNAETDEVLWRWSRADGWSRAVSATARALQQPAAAS